MPTFIQLTNFTEHGIENIEESPERLDEVKADVEAMGGEFHGFYMTFGRYDAVGIGSFPDAETAMQFSIALNQAGEVETETLLAFPEEEYRDVIAGLPD
ncbi:MAG: GYD domain-containing protein [Halobacteriaceae archaeon]